MDGGETPHRTVSLQEVMFNASLRNVELKPPTVITHTYIIYIYIKLIVDFCYITFIQLSWSH